MWLRNFHNLIATMLMYHNATSSGLTLRNTSGSRYYFLTSTTAAFVNSNIAPGFNANTNSANSQCYVIFGTGTTAPTYDDYKLESQWTTNLSRVATTGGPPYQIDADANSWGCDYETTISNAGSASVTVTEWGILSAQGSATQLFLLFRALLDTPVTLARYESATLYWTLTFRES